MNTIDYFIPPERFKPGDLIEIWTIYDIFFATLAYPDDITKVNNLTKNCVLILNIPNLSPLEKLIQDLADIEVFIKNERKILLFRKSDFYKILNYDFIYFS